MARGIRRLQAMVNDLTALLFHQPLWIYICISVMNPELFDVIGDPSGLL